MEFINALNKYIFREFLMKLPSRRIRLLCIRWYCKSVGENTWVGMGCDFRGAKKRITIGRHCVINPRITLDGRCGEIVIGDCVDIGQDTNIWSAEHDFNDPNHSLKGAGVIIEDHVWIASSVTILPGVKIGRGAVIACNSVVTKDVESMAIMGGIPAKKIGVRDNPLTYELNYKPMFI